MEKSKKKKMIICLISFIIVVAIILLIVGFGFLTNKGDVPEYINISYENPKESYCSCIHFGSNNSFGEYDCDSEPSSMPFSGEFYNKYRYDKKNQQIILYSKSFSPVILKVQKWTKDELKVKVIESPRDCNELCQRCSVNNEDEFVYKRLEPIAEEKIVLDNYDFDNYTIKYKIDDPSVVKLIKDLSDDYSEGFNAYLFKGIKRGETLISFEYVNKETHEVKKKIVYYAVSKDNYLKLEEKEEICDACVLKSGNNVISNSKNSKDVGITCFDVGNRNRYIVDYDIYDSNVVKFEKDVSNEYAPGYSCAMFKGLNEGSTSIRFIYRDKNTQKEYISTAMVDFKDGNLDLYFVTNTSFPNLYYD